MERIKTLDFSGIWTRIVEVEGWPLDPDHGHEINFQLIFSNQCVIITVYTNKESTASSAAYITIHDMRVHEIMKLYIEHVRQKFVKQDTDEPHQGSIL